MMNAKLKRFSLLVAAVALAAAMPGCPPDPPPFDASGDYAGSWSGTINNNGAVTVINDCQLDMSFFQLVDFPRINFHVAGTVELGWDCLLPPEVMALLGIQDATVSLPLLAVMSDAGALVLEAEFSGDALPPALAALLDTEGIEPPPLQQFVFTLDSQGTDTNDDGIMDGLSGTLSLSAAYMENGAEKMIGVDGTFSVQRTAM